MLLAREQIKVQQKSLDVSLELLSNVRKQVQVGTLVELDRCRPNRQSRPLRSLLAAAQAAYVTAKNNLKNLLSDKLRDWVDTEIEPSENLIAVNVPTDRAKAG